MIVGLFGTRHNAGECRKNLFQAMVRSYVSLDLYQLFRTKLVCTLLNCVMQNISNKSMRYFKRMRRCTPKRRKRLEGLDLIECRPSNVAIRHDGYTCWNCRECMDVLNVIKMRTKIFVANVTTCSRFKIEKNQERE